jgi:hypothetical protein
MMMDDLEFRRRCIADPFDQDKAFQRKRREQPEHEQLAVAQARFDRRLKELMEEVEVPQDLGARIRLRHSTQRRRRRRMFWTQGLAMAASVLLVIGVIRLYDATQPDLQQVVLSHVNSELKHLAERNEVRGEQLDALLREVGGHLRGDLGQVRYAGACQMRKHKGVHMVVQGEAGPVTVLIMPGEDLEQRAIIDDPRFKGVILPTPHGAMAVLGERSEPIEQTLERLRSAVGWSV